MAEYKTRKNASCFCHGNFGTSVAINNVDLEVRGSWVFRDFFFLWLRERMEAEGVNTHSSVSHDKKKGSLRVHCSAAQLDPLKQLSFMLPRENRFISAFIQRNLFLRC